MALLQTYHWPGNIRELRNVLERVAVETTADVIDRRAFDEWVRERSRFYPGTWDVNARETARATRPTIITPYPPALQPSPLLSSPIHDMESVTDGVWRLSGQSDLASLSRQESIDVTSYELAQPMTPERLAWAYQQAGGNITRAARLVGVHKATFYRHMKALGLTRENLESPGAMPLDQLAPEDRPEGEAHE